MTEAFPSESTNATILHARQCLATIGDTKMVQIGREHLQWLIGAAIAYEAYDRQCAWVQEADVGPLGWHVARIMTDMIYAAYPALRPAIEAHRAKVAAGQGAVPPMTTDAAEARPVGISDDDILRFRARFYDDSDSKSLGSDLRQTIRALRVALGGAARERDAFTRGAEAMQRTLADALRDHLNPRAAAIANATPVPDYRP